MSVLPRRALLAIAVVVEVALQGHERPIAAKSLASRHGLPPRHLESLLQTLVHANILKGVRGPRGGYELARERRRITAASVLRAVSSENGGGEAPHCRLVMQLVAPIVEAAGKAFLEELETITIDDICRRAEDLKLGDEKNLGADFAI